MTRKSVASIAIVICFYLIPSQWMSSSSKFSMAPERPDTMLLHTHTQDKAIGQEIQESIQLGGRLVAQEEERQW